ncbi:MAG: septal ring lytic transglycosylase RlpA family protein [Verrucomicrobiales bacterium]
MTKKDQARTLFRLGSILGVAGLVLVLPGCALLEQIGGTSSGLARLGLRKTGQVHQGRMSWYSVGTNGGTQTASGERFSDSGATAAHKTLPMGTMVEVTNLANDRSSVVRINDRGPFVPGRIIDVSIGVARKLDFVGTGVTPCRVEVLTSGGERS